MARPRKARVPRTGTAAAAPPRAAAKTPAPAPSLPLDDRVALVLAFAGSACLLILEIVAGRLLAPMLGVSLYTWTAVIGVVLAGVSLGNYLGGRLADKRPSRATVALIYLAGSLASLAVLLLVRYAEHLQLPSGAPAILQVLWLTGLLFFVPSTIIAAATPVLTRLSLHSVAEGGRVVGRIQAAAALGSILGTFLTGFLLISGSGRAAIVAGVAVTLLLLAIAARPPWLWRRVVRARRAVRGDRRRRLGVPQRLLPRERLLLHQGRHGRASASRRRAATRRPGGDFRALYLDRLLHGIVDLSQPTFLYYPYEQIYAFADRLRLPAGQPDRRVLPRRRRVRVPALRRGAVQGLDRRRGDRPGGDRASRGRSSASARRRA